MSTFPLFYTHVRVTSPARINVGGIENNFMEELRQDIMTTINSRGINALFVEANDAERLIQQIATIFDLKLNRLFVWETSKAQGVLMAYDGSTDIWEGQLLAFISDFQSEVFLVLTNEAYYPWPVLKCKKEEVVTIISEQFFFEYFIFDSTMNKIVFDTHQNMLQRYSI
ncbi:hypothetical protein [Niabella drilacis]|uniref:Uncharacterized protein n=1 Tax=Niabella drilacis (strain DSM 25811 / CCM 8410 / CCUG 62505 / LMG 26954 / E90) TaxID=1285928 RepID=A0A1G6I7V1_NIADE|nr:hypothetical protein [Niabella drilacis]SDC02105.1 hypothetical protein SAMN04487894_101113 [Niabella drilacis]